MLILEIALGVLLGEALFAGVSLLVLRARRTREQQEIENFVNRLNEQNLASGGTDAAEAEDEYRAQYETHTHTDRELAGV